MRLTHLVGTLCNIFNPFISMTSASYWNLEDGFGLFEVDINHTQYVLYCLEDLKLKYCLQSQISTLSKILQRCAVKGALPDDLSGPPL